VGQRWRETDQRIDISLQRHAAWPQRTCCVRRGAEIPSCARGVCAPNALMAPIHDRMPVILLPDDEEAWLDPDLIEVEQITRYLRPYPDELLEAARAS
jgi:putative SOS response-associated peptidase YedK